MKTLLALISAVILPGCSMVVLDPSGYVAVQEARLLVISTALMLLIIVPVIVLTLLFAWRYRASNKDAPYAPDWDHSIQLELLIWSAPLLIIIALGALTWIGTHTLDPYRPLDERAVPGKAEPIDVQVVALDWKWLFIYPEYGVASVNEMAAPVNRPISFHLTSENMMNAFFVPALSGMIYAMPGMESRLHAVINYPGEYQGLSSNYSGAGFSGMRFRFHGLEPADFDSWIAETRASQEGLDRPEYLDLAAPSMNVPPRAFGSVDPELFHRVVNRCVEEGRMCTDEMMMVDAGGGTGLAGTINVVPAEDRVASVLGSAPVYVGTMCTVADSVAQYGPDTLALLDPLPSGPRASARTVDDNL
jgi:cytochrome o ubiquinol oxidase subunit II